METLTPLTLEVALAVQHELQQRLDEADRLRRQHVERARYEADLARDRFLQVDPKNRLVADALEADWNEKLRALTEAQEQYERQRQADRAVLDQESQSRILALTTDFPKLWKDPKTPERERKRMVRLLIEDVTLSKGEQSHRSGAVQRRGDADVELTPASAGLGNLADEPRSGRRGRPPPERPHRCPDRRAVEREGLALRERRCVHEKYHLPDPVPVSPPEPV